LSVGYAGDMRCLLPVATCLLIASFVMVSCSRNQEGQRLAIMAVLQMQQDAWNQGDLSRFLEGYLQSPDVTFIGAEFTQGFSGLEERYQRTYGGDRDMGRLTFGELSYQALGDHAAYVLGRYVLEREDNDGGNASGRFTIVFRKTGDGWKIVHDHTSAD
jgi:ketosteroid isomerase-like protein